VAAVLKYVYVRGDERSHVSVPREGRGQSTSNSFAGDAMMVFDRLGFVLRPPRKTRCNLGQSPLDCAPCPGQGSSRDPTLNGHFGGHERELNLRPGCLSWPMPVSSATSRGSAIGMGRVRRRRSALALGTCHLLQTHGHPLVKGPEPPPGTLVGDPPWAEARRRQGSGAVNPYQRGPRGGTSCLGLQFEQSPPGAELPSPVEADRATSRLTLHRDATSW